MAKKPAKSDAKPQGRPAKVAAESPPPDQTTLIFPPESLIKKLAKAKEDAKKQTQSISGTLGEMIGKATEEKHVDRKALSMACQLRALDDERLHITYFHLLRYIDDLGIAARAKAQEELFEEHRPKSGSEAGDAVAGNVTQIGTAARRVAEGAGEAASA